MKRFFSALLSVSVLASSLFLPAPSLANELSSSFADVYDDHEYLEAIEYLKINDIVEGYEVEGDDERQFRPDYQLNRAELAKIMIEAEFSTAEIDDCLQDKILKDWKTMYFSDVPIDIWYAKYVCVAKEKEIIDGYPDGTFKGVQAVNFAESAKMIANTLELEPGLSVTGEEWFKPHVRALEGRQGIPPTIRSFPKPITRAEMARMIHAGKEEVDEDGIALTKLEEFDSREADLPQVHSCDVLIDKLEDMDDNRLDYGRGPVPMMEFDAMEMADEEASFDGNAGEGSPAPEAPVGALRSETTSGATESKQAENFSETNVQVVGVDEADIIKNDGRYIYMIKGNTVRIVDAHPGTTMKELSSIELDDSNFTPQEIYVDGDRMVIIGQVWKQRYYPRPLFRDRMAVDSMIAPSFDQSRTKVYVYNLRSRRNPRMDRRLEMEGSYQSSRKIDNKVYFVLNQWIPYYSFREDLPADVILPRFKDSAHADEEKPLVRCMDVQYFPRFSERNYLIVAGLDIANHDKKLQRKVLLGSSQNIYASRENLYVASTQWPYYDFEEEDGVFDEPETSTSIYRFKLSPEEIEYQERGSVPGTILNQFSMDENGQYFRIATTRDRYNESTDTWGDNNLYVLDRDDMNIVGSVEGIAPGEHIKSVRFMGRRAYMVTFKQVDPLFVISLASPRSPKILGKLKIPGWSDYLHPYDENHLIGFGREVDPSAENAEFLTREFLLGMKISIFDVSDVRNPIESHKTIIGARGTDSELLRNHKALLFNKDRNLLAFPITITERDEDSNCSCPPGAECLVFCEDVRTVFSGGIVFDVDLSKGFTEVGKVTHYEDDSVFENAGEWWYGELGRNIQRMLYIGDYLYSVSPDYIRSYDLHTVDPVSFIKLAGPKSDDVKYLEEPVEF